MTPGGSSKAPRRFGISSTITGTKDLRHGHCKRRVCDALWRKPGANAPLTDHEDAEIEHVDRFIVADDADRRIDPNEQQGRHDGNTDRDLVHAMVHLARDQLIGETRPEEKDEGEAEIEEIPVPFRGELHGHQGHQQQAERRADPARYSPPLPALRAAPFAPLPTRVVLSCFPVIDLPPYFSAIALLR